MSFKKIKRKKFVAKFDFIAGGPDVLLIELICLLTSLPTNESPLITSQLFPLRKVKATR